MHFIEKKVRGGSAGVIESVYGVIKPLSIVDDSNLCRFHNCRGHYKQCNMKSSRICFLRSHNDRNRSIEVRPSGKLPSGTTEIPFSVILRQPSENLGKFYETFHGTDINIQYLVTVGISRGYLHKSLSATIEFIVESDTADFLERPLSSEMVIFYITQDTQRHPLLPELKSGGFRVTGKMATLCSLSDPITGELTVEASAVPISSIDIHLCRVESVILGERIITETSVIQTTQIADGDVCRNITLPIYAILPRLLTCPTVFAGPFSIEFKVYIVITFQSELSKLHPKTDPRTPRLWLAIESLPLELLRCRSDD
ncbi:Down syndrome critical region protein 3 [Cucurbita argyrosperma subsp. argyrosperma]|nr:Down syndrome critical region protein 3 [Cucurbita argyrosperma subsp. argyrosperma]